MFTEEEIMEVVQGIVDNFLIPKFKELKMNATGDWLDALEVRASNNKGEVWGKPYTEQLVNGRKYGKMPPIAPLEKWVVAKLNLQGSKARSAAFAIAKKIAKEGTSWYEQGGSDLLEILESKEVKDYIALKMQGYAEARIQVQILRIVRENLETNE